MAECHCLMASACHEVFAKSTHEAYQYYPLRMIIGTHEVYFCLIGTDDLPQGYWPGKLMGTDDLSHGYWVCSWVLMIFFMGTREC